MATRWRRSWPLLLAGVILLGTWTSAAAAKESLARQLAEARLAAIADGNPSGAVAALRPIVAQATGSVRAEAADDLGDALDALGRVVEARQAYLEALAADPRNARAARHLVVLGGLAALPEATGSPQPAIVSRPGLGSSWEALLPEAERAAFGAQVEAFARNRAAQDLLAEARRLWQAREFDRGLALLDELVTQFPAQLKPADLLDIGGRAQAMDRPDLAALAYGAAASREDPRHAPWASYQQGLALMQAGNMSAARVAFGRVLRAGALARDPGGKPLDVLAEEHLRECLGLASWSAYLQVRSLFSQAEQAQYVHHDFVLAETLYRRIVDEFPASNYDGRALVQLATIAYFERRQSQQALQDIQAVLSDDRRNDIWPDGMRAGAWALYYEGRIKEASGDRPGARAAYRSLLAEFPDASDHDGKPFAAKAEQRLAMLEGRP